MKNLIRKLFFEILGPKLIFKNQTFEFKILNLLSKSVHLSYKLEYILN